MSDFYFHHIPDSESCAIKLRPDITPLLVLVRLVAVCIPVEHLNEGAREIYFLRVRRIKRDDGTNFLVEGGIGGRGRLLAVRSLR